MTFNRITSCISCTIGYVSCSVHSSNSITIQFSDVDNPLESWHNELRQKPVKLSAKRLPTSWKKLQNLQFKLFQAHSNSHVKHSSSKSLILMTIKNSFQIKIITKNVNFLFKNFIWFNFEITVDSAECLGWMETDINLNSFLQN